MDFKYTVLLVLIIRGCSCKMQINVQAAANKNDISIIHYGQDNKLVTDKEITLFNLTDDNLKYGVKRDLGKIPKYVFLKDPTPYNNLFAKFKWKEVHRNIRIDNVEVYGVVSSNVTLKRHNIINNTTTSLKKTVELYESVDNEISSTWSFEELPDDEVFYDVVLYSGQEPLQYENKWRHNNTRSLALNFGVTNNGHILVEPGQIVTIKLQAIKTIILVKVVYKTSLIGCVIANYARRYGWHYFWAPTIASIMERAHLNNEIITKEFIEIRCYVAPRLEIVDKDTQRPIRIIKPLSPFRASKSNKPTE